MQFKHLEGKALPADAEARHYLNSKQNGVIVDLVEVEIKEVGSQTLLNTWMMWMQETAEFMSWQGVTMPLYIRKNGEKVGLRKFEQRDAHDLFTSQYLGVDEKGRRKTWSRPKKKKNNEIQASIGDRLFAMDTHKQWCMEKGIKLTVKKDSEYMKLKAEQGEASAHD
jgi:hypothetical protein